MEAVKIDIYISDLLYSYDCVIVPDFGGFVANYAPAKLKEVKHQFLPPSKQISFNRNLKNNDGLLTNHISQRREISFQEANQLIRAFVDRSIAGLRNGDKIKIDKVGTLYLDPEENIQFIEEEQNDFLLDSFGLQTFRALPIQRETVEEQIQEKLKSGSVVKSINKNNNQFIWKAAAIFFFILTGTLFLSRQFDPQQFEHLQYSFFTPEMKVESKYSGREIELPAKDGAEEELLTSAVFENEDLVQYQAHLDEPSQFWVASKEKEVKEIETLEADNTKVVAEEKTDLGLRYHVMGGCFSNYANATGLTEQLSSMGYEARLLGTYKSLHAVSYGSFSNRSEAVALLKRVQDEHNPSAWLLEREF